MSDLGAVQGDIIKGILRIPSVLTQESLVADDEEWQSIEVVIDEALENILNFRIHKKAKPIK